MTYHQLRNWGAELDDDEFACALAALGCGCFPAVNEVEESLRTKLVERPTPWRFEETSEEFHKEVSPREAARIWRRAVQGAMLPRPGQLPIGVQLAVHDWMSESGEDESLVRLNTALARAVGVGSVTWVTALEPASGRWNWPLDIGLFDDPASRELAARLEGSPFGQFRRLVAVDEASGPLDLVLVSGELEQVWTASAAPPGLSACAVVVLGGAGSAGDPMLALEVLRRRVGAQAAVLLRIEENRRAQWLVDLTVSLAHDTPLDVALFDMSRAAGAANPIMVGREHAFRGTRLSEQARRAALAIIEATKAPPEKRRPTPAQIVGHRLGGLLLTPRTRSLGSDDVLDAVREHIDRLEWTHESDEATRLLGLLEGVDELTRTREPTPRFLQGQVSDPAGEKRPDEGLIAERPYLAEVWIGPPTADAIVADQPFVEPEMTEERLELQVHWVELTPGAGRPLPEPQSGSIPLPRAGASEPARFRFKPPEGVDEYVARIVVTHRARVLQTALFRLPVGGRITESRGPRMNVESLLRTFEGASASGRGFDASLLVNETPAGQPLLTAIRRGQVQLLPLGVDITQLCVGIGSALDRYADAQDSGDLFSEETRKLFVTLASKGALLRGSLRDFEDNAEFTKARRIQLLSLKPDAVLPVEICYEGPGPNQSAQLCAGSVESLRRGKCSGRCAGPTKDTICPLAFWGLSKQIERHVSVAAVRKALEGSEYGALRQEEVARRTPLPLGEDVLWAVSRRVEVGARGTTAAGQKALKQAFGARAHRARSWTDWAKTVHELSPGMLALVAHTGLTADADVMLEIEREEQLSLAQVDREYVASGDQVRPIVALLGCSTASPEVGPFTVISRFRQSGAAIVVGTIGKVIGRHSVPTAVALLGELRAARAGAKHSTLGDVLLAVRRALVAEGRTMGLGLLAFGDADWRL